MRDKGYNGPAPENILDPNIKQYPNARGQKWVWSGQCNWKMKGVKVIIIKLESKVQLFLFLFTRNFLLYAIVEEKNKRLNSPMKLISFLK